MPRREPRAADAACADRRRAHCRAAADPLRERRACHLPRASEALRQRRRPRSPRCPELSRRGGRRAIRVSARAKPRPSLTRARQNGAQLLFIGEAAVSAAAGRARCSAAAALRQGRHRAAAAADHRHRRRAAMLGGRRQAGAPCSPHEIGRAGFVIASGLARGIDGMAHQAALDTAPSPCWPAASTISIRPSTPSCSAQIGERGCLVSEMPFGFTPRGQDFPRRNRIVSGVVAGRGHRRGGAALGQARHRAAGRRAGPRSVRRARAIRSTRAPRAPTSFEVGRHAGDRARGRAGGADAVLTRAAGTCSSREGARAAEPVDAPLAAVGKRPRPHRCGARPGAGRHRQPGARHRPQHPQRADRPDGAGAGRAHRAPRRRLVLAGTGTA